MASDLFSRLLIIDDDPTNIRLLANIFSTAAQHYDILFTMNSAQGIDMAVQEQPDLILLDIMMPDINGYEICKQLKSNELTQSIPIIFITAVNDMESEVLGLELGASDFIVKPFYPAIVKIRVQNQLELCHARKALTQLALTDGLTGVSNRRHFDEQLASEWARAARNGQSVSIAMVDVDWFKKYNDFYGHQMGDECLRKVADALAFSAKRGGDFVARYGGEEFALIFPATQNPMVVIENAFHLLEEMAIPHDLSEFGRVTLSAGVAICSRTDHQGNSGMLLNTADIALYEAKKQGRNQIVMVDV
jgi:diguanylate cyclase (GGDEF)-like protein